MPRRLCLDMPKLAAVHILYNTTHSSFRWSTLLGALSGQITWIVVGVVFQYMFVLAVGIKVTWKSHPKSYRLWTQYYKLATRDRQRLYGEAWCLVCTAVCKCVAQAQVKKTSE